MYNILVVEDEENILKLMEIRLKKSGFNVLTAQNGLMALEVISRERVDLMITDIMMPEMDGFELVEKIRSRGINIPVIMSTVRETIEDKTKAYELGIDDYMVKPISHDELVLRINAVLRRSGTKESNLTKIGNVVIDGDNLVIYDENQTVQLTKKEYELIFKLLSNPNHTFSKSKLLDELWGYESDSYEETLKVHINRVRKKIKNFPEIDIQTVHGVGYKGVINIQNKK